MNKEIFEKLSREFEGDAIETEKGKTGWKKGKTIHYIKYAYLVKRFNEVLGINKWKAEFEVLSCESGVNHNKTPYWEVVGRMVIQGEDIGYNEAFGGNKSYDSMTSAHKGAWSDGFKKCAALTGCGWSTYAGLLDPDAEPENAPSNEAKDNKEQDYSEQKNAWSRCRELAKRMNPDDPWSYVVEFVRTKSPQLDRNLYKTFPLEKIPVVEKALSEHIKKELDKAQHDEKTGEIPDSHAITKDQIKKLYVLYKPIFADNEKKRREYIQEVTGKASTKDLTKIEAIGLIKKLEDYDPAADQWS